MTALPEEPGSLDRYSPETLFYATFAALLEDFWLKPFAYQPQYSVTRKKVSQFIMGSERTKNKCLSKQDLVDKQIYQFKLTHINLVDIQVADGKVSLDAPMSLLAKIPHNIHGEFVVGNVNCFPIITSYDCW